MFEESVIRSGKLGKTNWKLAYGPPNNSVTSICSTGPRIMYHHVIHHIQDPDTFWWRNWLFTTFLVTLVDTPVPSKIPKCPNQLFYNIEQLGLEKFSEESVIRSRKLGKTEREFFWPPNNFCHVNLKLRPQNDVSACNISLPSSWYSLMHKLIVHKVFSQLGWHTGPRQNNSFLV